MKRVPMVVFMLHVPVIFTQLDPKQLEGQTISTAKSCCFNCCNKVCYLLEYIFIIIKSTLLQIIFIRAYFL